MRNYGIEEKKDIINTLKKNGYDEVSSFLTYPKANVNNIFGTGSTKNVELEDDYINSDAFLNDINLDSGIVFVGLNYAQRVGGYDGRGFQTMHDYKKGNDAKLAASLIDLHGTPSAQTGTDTIENTDSLDKSEAYGSFVFDIINKFSCTNLKGFVNSLKKLLKEKKPSLGDVSNFDMSAVPNYDYSEFAARCTDPKHKDGKPSACPTCKAEILNRLVDRLTKYDIPSFVYLMNLIKPKGVICLGVESKDLVDTINELYGLGLHVEKATHYSAQSISIANKRNSIHQAVENILNA